MSFFGFETTLPDLRGGPSPGAAPHGFRGFQPNNADQTFSFPGAGEEEDLAVYTWGEGLGDGHLAEGGDDLNDETFSGGPIGNDFQFAPQSAPLAASQQPKKPAFTAPRGPIASTQSRYKPKPAADPFAASEDDFYSSRPNPKKATLGKIPVVTMPTPAAPVAFLEDLWSRPTAGPMWGAAPSSVTKPAVQAQSKNAQVGARPPPIGQIKTLDEIEAEMSRVAVTPQAFNEPKVLSLEEVERQMMAGAPGPMETPSLPRHNQQQQPAPPHREVTPVPPGLAGSGYASQQALLDSMFPQLGAAPTLGVKTASFPPGADEQRQPSPADMARMQVLHQRVTAKIESMARYNNLMGSSDKDFITRIQLSQLATADPYTSDFYAQVLSALKRSRMATQPSVPNQPGQSEVQQHGPSVVQVASGLGLGVGGAVENRFGKMGNATMQKLSSQVKKLVENRNYRLTNTAALQGALGRVSRGNAAGPRPVLSIPTGSKPEHRPVSQLNQSAGPQRQALSRKQILMALEELYDSVLELEQMRRDMPPPTAMEEVERWNSVCMAKVDEIWRRLMVMEPLDVSNPHPFISLLNPVKGQKLFPRLLRHLNHHQTLTLLTLLIATYPQLDVVARAPPPPLADASLLTKADRLDRAKREAETDNFLHCVIPGVDMLINRCTLGLAAGLLGICAQRMEIWKVASTRPGVALFTALLSKAQSMIRAPAPDPTNPQQSPTPDPAEVEQWSKTYAYFLQPLLPHLTELFPSSAAQKAAFGPGAYLMGGGADQAREGIEMERREAEVWGFAAVLAVNAPEEEQTNLVGALREKILHTVQAAHHPSISPQQAEMKLRNVNMFLNGLGLDASMIE